MRAEAAHRRIASPSGQLDQRRGTCWGTVMHLGPEPALGTVRNDPVRLPRIGGLASLAGASRFGTAQFEASGEGETVAAVGAGQGHRPDVSPGTFAVDDRIELPHRLYIAPSHKVEHETHVAQQSRLGEMLSLVLFVALERQVGLCVPVAQRIVGQQLACQSRHRRVVDAPCLHSESGGF